MRDRVVVAGYVAFDHPLVGVRPVSCEAVSHPGDGIIGASIGPESIGVDAKVRFPYRLEDHPEGFLYNPIAYPGNAEGPFLPVGFWDVHPSDRQWFKVPGCE